MSNRTEVLEHYLYQENIYHFEGETGVAQLTKIVELLGYKRTYYKYGEAIEVFLADNPSVIEAILEFLHEQVDQNLEWKEAIEAEMPPFEDTDEAEEGK